MERGANAGAATRQLLAVYDEPLRPAQQHASIGGRVAGLLSHTVPWELVRAAGLFPTLVRSRLPAPASDEWLEDDVFSPRVRSLCRSAIAGAWSFMHALLVGRTSEQDYKLYLYLREMSRAGFGANVPPTHLYDLLHTRSPEAYAYGLDRTRALVPTLEMLAGRRLSDADLESAILESNAARAAVRQLLALRRDPPRISGALALGLIGPLHLMARTDYAALAGRAVAELENQPAIRGPRLVIKGAPLDHAGLHEALESQGAVVVAEDDGWGARSAGADIATDRDPITAIFEKYCADTSSPRVFPPSVADEWFETAIGAGVDGVVFFLPPDDSVAGWDYPRERLVVDRVGLQSLVIRADASQTLSPEWQGRIRDFVSSVSQDH